jgi:hypothetical protein
LDCASYCSYNISKQGFMEGPNFALKKVTMLYGYIWYMV